MQNFRTQGQTILVFSFDFGKAEQLLNVFPCDLSDANFDRKRKMKILRHSLIETMEEHLALTYEELGKFKMIRNTFKYI